jgi:uncharacterized membrane protein
VNNAIADLGTLPGGFNSLAEGINDAGVVVGFALDANGFEDAVMWPNGPGSITIILAASNSTLSYIATGINNNGDIVGEFTEVFPPNIQQHLAWVLRKDGNGGFLDSLIPQGTGWTIPSALGINDSGQIVGFGIINGQQHAIRLDPQ